MKSVYAIAIAVGVMFAGQTGHAKARPMPKPKPKPPIHACPKGQVWNAPMKMCMPK